MLHSPLFFVWIGWVLVVGAIAVVRSRYVRRENAERERRREERASRQVDALRIRSALRNANLCRPAIANTSSTPASSNLRAIPPDRACVPRASRTRELALAGKLTLALTPGFGSGVSCLAGHDGLRAGA